MIDPVTPENVKSRTSTLGEEYDLVFSDEFETEGRTFYEGMLPLDIFISR